MTRDQTEGIGLDPRGKLSQLRRDHPQHEIRLMATQMWEAVSHPSPGQTIVHCAGGLDELRAKIEGDAP
jgi:hypothetical protein